MKKDWIKTDEMLRLLREHPNVEMEFTHYLGGLLRSTYWGEYDGRSNRFGLSTDWNYSCCYTEEELLKEYEGHLWHRDV